MSTAQATYPCVRRVSLQETELRLHLLRLDVLQIGNFLKVYTAQVT